ncbi:hypothetical protein AGOR_G00153860 [Albula goreensis]|uniref:Uncharacterized protein n=1 Tax=Albula goreensis TaxID=1534307 RepID=A0A8T3CYQ9_9TELE|nr:hypothetical protein AGOR_G00153860 [Albula goreensis]
MHLLISAPHGGFYQHLLFPGFTMTHLLVSLRMAVCGGVLLASAWWKVGGAEGPLPVPSLSIKSPYKGLDIELFMDVVLACTTPYGAPYPIIVFLGRASEPREEILSVEVTTVATASFTLGAVAQNEGAFLCWYNVSKTGEQSGPSNSVTITLCE